MAQLPPKVPITVTQDNNHHQWQELIHDDNHHNPSWVDEFMEFSTNKRGAHRRSVSDSSVAFIEAGTTTVPFLGQFRTSETEANKRDDQFDKFDEEQFMSMFSNELGSSSNPSSTSDHNSTNEDQKSRPPNTARPEEREPVEEIMKGAKNEAEEVESSCKIEKGSQAQAQAPIGTHHGGMPPVGGVATTDSGDHQQVVDPKRVKRILANRQSAQRSRVRKLHYISDLERSVTSLQSEVSVLSPRVAFLDHQRMMLNVDNSTLKAKIAALAQDKIFKDAHQEALKREIERLRHVYYQQSLKKTEGTITPPPPPPSSPLPSPAVQPPPPLPDTIVNESEQLIG